MMGEAGKNSQAVESSEARDVPQVWQNISERQLAIALVDAGVLTSEQLSSIRGASQGDKNLLDAILEANVADEEQIAKKLSEYYHLPVVRLASVAIDSSLFRFIPEKMAREHHCVPISLQENQLTIAMYNPLDFAVISDLEFGKNLQVKIVLSTRSGIYNVIDSQYGLVNALQTFMSGISGPDEDAITITSQGRASTDLEAAISTEAQPVVRLVNLVISDAVEAKASDIHIEPGINLVKVRYRLDGVLHDQQNLPKWVQNAVVSRFKVMANLDISERRIPQDGRLNIVYRGRSVDLRISTLPTHFGEKAVIRVLDQSHSFRSLKGLGLEGRNLGAVKDALRSPQGMMLATGPTGSGKSSSLFVALQAIRTGHTNIVTIEDPIEYQIAGISQVQVDTRAGLTFATALRSILRQDPDVILVGEIRDSETAELAFQAAQTGHLVLSTLHTNDTISTLSRLAELGVPPTLVAESLLLTISQRLARRNCPRCSEKYMPEEEVARRLGLAAEELEFRRGVGCKVCRDTGYSGRVGLFEVLRMEPQISDLIIKGADSVDLRAAAADAGMVSLLEDAVEKIREGILCPDEVFRVVATESEHQRKCSQCNHPLEPGCSVCPSCSHDLSERCPGCGEEMDPEWPHCPHCRTPADSEPAPAQPPRPDPDEGPLEIGTSPEIEKGPANRPAEIQEEIPNSHFPEARPGDVETPLLKENEDNSSGAPEPIVTEPPPLAGQEPQHAETDAPGAKGEVAAPVLPDGAHPLGGINGYHSSNDPGQSVSGESLQHSKNVKGLSLPSGTLSENKESRGGIGDLPGQLGEILVPDTCFRILIVDDDIITCNRIALLLRRIRFRTEIKVATDGIEAIKLIEKKLPHLIILDLIMPEMDGFEIMKKLRQNLATAFIPVIVITGTSPGTTKHMAARFGADVYLSKPIDPSDLEKCVRGLLRKVYAI